MISILLNGPSSAGKSSIAKMLKAILHNDFGLEYKVITLDDYLEMSPEEPIWEDDVFKATSMMCRDIALSLNNGYGVIIDHVMTSERIYKAVWSVLPESSVMKVLVTCSIEMLRKREEDRGNRCAGSAEASLRYLFPKDGYDILVDTSERSAKGAADAIFYYLLLNGMGCCDWR